jgi:hypothetical protein
VNRWFAKGEIAQFPKPAVGGVTPSVWQSDVKIRWRDGKGSCSVTAATNATPIKITCANHGFHDGERVVIAGATGNTAVNGTWTIQKVSANTFELLNSIGNGTYTGNGIASGPGPGSVRHALVSFRYDRPASGQSVTVSFTDDANQCSAGNSAACDSAGLDAAGMAAFNGGTWAAVSQTTATGITHMASARTMLADGKFSYWLRGPAVTQVIAEDATGFYDWGYDCGANCWATFTSSDVNTTADTVTIPNHGLKTGDRLSISGNYPSGMTYGNSNDWDFACPVDTNTLKFSNNDPSCSSTIDLTSTGSGTVSLQTPRTVGWGDNTTHKSLHPLFILTFYTGWAGVKVEYAMQNVWTSAVQDQRYDLLLTNSAGTADSFPGYTHFANTVWRRVIWDGAEPGGIGQEKLSIKLDLNLPYLIYAKAVPPLLNYTLNGGTVSSLLNTYTANTSSQHGPMYCAGTFGCGNLPISTGQTEGADNVGLLSAWDAVHLRTMTPQTRQMSEGNADNYGQAWFGWRENALPSGKYDHAGTIQANGRWASVAARPDMSFEGPSNVPSSVGAVSPARLPSKDTGHHAESGMAYILSGEWWHLQIAQAQASWMAANRDKNDRKYTMGLYAPESQPHYYAWPVRDIGYAALISPDGTPEQSYFQYIFNQNVGYWEGVFNVSKGRFLSQPTSSPFNYGSEFGSAWQLGRFGPIGMGAKNPLAIVRGFKDSGQEVGSNVNSVVTPSTNDGTSFMNWFLFDVFGFFAHAGLPGKELVEAMSGFSIAQVMEDPSKYSPYLMPCYNCPGVPADEVEPKLAANVSGSDVIFPVDMIPDWWEAPMTVFIGGWAPKCNGECIRICSIDRNAKTVGACAGGRGFGAGLCSGSGGHSSGDTLRSLRPFQSVRDMVRGFSPSYIATRTAQTNFTGEQGWAWGDDSYTAYAFSALSWHYPYTFHGATGQSAWDWMKGKFDASGVASYNGKFLFAPYFDPVQVKATPGDTFVILEYTKPRADQACTVDGVSDGITNSRLVRFVKTGLAPSTPGSSTIRCTSDPYRDTVVSYTTSAALTGTGTYEWTTAGTNMRINYGATAALGASTGFQACAVQCSAALPKGLQYVQLERAGGAKGEIMPVLIR